MKISQKLENIKNAFPLVSTEEINLLNDYQNYYRYNELIRKEYFKTDDKKTHGLTEKGKELKEFQDLYSELKSFEKIRLKCELLNELEKIKETLYNRFSKAEYLDKKIFLDGGGITKKFKDVFLVDDIEKKIGCFNYKFRTHLSSDSNGIYFYIHFSGWNEEIRISFNDNDKLRLFKYLPIAEQKEIIPFVKNEKINAKKEILNVRKFLQYEKESKKKLSELRNKTNYYTFDLIKSENINKI